MTDIHSGLFWLLIYSLSFDIVYTTATSDTNKYKNIPLQRDKVEKAKKLR
ncbi:MAG: hypothetical protein V7K40_15325 [Nostoc sp.]